MNMDMRIESKIFYTNIDKTSQERKNTLKLLMWEVHK
jgi:hypothetical protein